MTSNSINSLCYLNSYFTKDRKYLSDLELKFLNKKRHFFVKTGQPAKYSAGILQQFSHNKIGTL
jgi:hypothetical protein